MKAVNGNTDSVAEVAEHLTNCSFMKLQGGSEQGIMFVYELDVSCENYNWKRCGNWAGGGEFHCVIMSLSWQW